MKNLYAMTDKAILVEIGERIKRKRLEKNMSQEKLAISVGLDRTTVGLVEKGKSFTVLTLIEIMRGLKILEGINSFLPEVGLSPIELSKLKGNQRQRASRNKNKKG
ncbi:helix-turn-helix transcriptional regulator [Candidatus Omnitrophota bacterium]